MTSCFGGSTPILGRKRITLLQPDIAPCLQLRTMSHWTWRGEGFVNLKQKKLFDTISLGFTIFVNAPFVKKGSYKRKVFSRNLELNWMIHGFSSTLTSTQSLALDTVPYFVDLEAVNHPVRFASLQWTTLYVLHYCSDPPCAFCIIAVNNPVRFALLQWTTLCVLHYFSEPPCTFCVIAVNHPVRFALLQWTTLYVLQYCGVRVFLCYSAMNLWF